MSKSHPKFDLSKYKKFYQSIGAVRCPYFGGEEVAFNSKGFNHLLFKYGKFRSFHDQKRRLELLVYCRRILENEYKAVKYSTKRKGDSLAEFWAFSANIDGMEMRLIVRRVDNGHKHFFGIMPIKH